MNLNETLFRIAGHEIYVSFVPTQQNDITLLPSFGPFAATAEATDGGCAVSGHGDGRLFSIHVDDTLQPVAPEARTRIDTFDTGNGTTVADSIEGGGYQFIIKDTAGNSCALLQTNADYTRAKCALNGTRAMRQFGLNSAMMMMYAFSGSFHKTLLIHASLVRNNGYGYAFIAKSGTGKSTHTSLWMRHIEGCDLMNDDNPIIRIIDGEAFIYGSPWSGKTPCYRNVKAPLGAITKIDRALKNSVEKIPPVKALAQILPACSSMKWDKTVYRNTYDTIIELVTVSPYNYILHCLPDREAAIICHKTISRK